MNYIHLFTPREIIVEGKVPGGLEKIVVDWYSMLESDTENNHYLYSFTDPDRETKACFDKHIVTPLKIGRASRAVMIIEDLQKIILKNDIDVVINHAFSDGKKMVDVCKALNPPKDKKLHIINICHSTYELLVTRAPFLPYKELYSDPKSYTEERPQIRTTTFVPSSEYAAYTFLHGEPNFKLNPLGLQMYVFDGFFNIVPDSNPRPVKESDGSIVMIGRAVGLKRLPETIKMLKGYDGPIHVFTKYRERNAIVTRLEKMAADTDNYNLTLHIDADREEMMEQVGKAKCLISGCAFETGPIIGLESGEVGVPAIVAKNSNFDQKYGYQTIMRGLPHWSFNVEEYKENPNLLLDIIKEIPEDMEFRTNLRDGLLDLRGRSKFRQKFYEMVDHITSEENQNKYCLKNKISSEPLF